MALAALQQQAKPGPGGETGARTRKPPANAMGPLTALAARRLAMQAIGNQQMLRRLQKKTTVSQPHDPDEIAADRMADAVMGSDPTALQGVGGNVSGGASGTIYRKCNCGTCADCTKEDDQALQRKPMGGATTSPPASLPAVVSEVLQSSGEPLAPSARDYFEPRFGSGFAGVRIHSDPRAAESARAVNALAYTVGRDVVFGAGRYAPHSAEGRRLLAHELAHVVQQQRRGASHKPVRGAEHDAASAAAQASVGPVLQRQPAGPEEEPPRPGTGAYIAFLSISMVKSDQTTHWGPDGEGKRRQTIIEYIQYAGAHPRLKSLYDEAVAAYPDIAAAATNTPSGPSAAQPVPQAVRDYVAGSAAPRAPVPAPAGGPSRPAARQNRVLASIPVTFTAADVGSEEGRRGFDQPEKGALSVPGYPLTSLGLGSNVLASGDLSWLSNADAARRVLGPEYWEPLFVPARRVIPLDRIIGTPGEPVELLRDLGPRIEGEIAERAAGSPRPLSWTRRGFTEPELVSIPDLVRRLDEGGLSGLTPQELAFLRRAAAIQSSATSPGSPLVSYSRAGFNVQSVGGKQYRVRVEVPRSAVVDLSQPNAFNEQGALQDLLNVDEAEFLVAANHQGRLVSVQRLAGTEEASFALRYGSEIRWGGRILLVAGLAVSAYRIADAPPAQRAEVTGEEIGGQVLGYAGTVAAVAACVGLGIATGGVGLLLCGLAGGIGGGLLGSALGGAAVRSLQYQTSGPSRPATELEAQQSAEAIARANIEPVCPSCHQLRLQWDERLRFRALGGSPRSGAKLTPEELARLRDWLEAGSPKQ